jgi:hypothetical protein
MTETAPESQKPSCLKKSTLNVVGESHSTKESEGDRDREKAFVRAKMGTDAQYWQEIEFSPGGKGADSMELRCAQSSAELLKRFALVCKLADGTAKQVKIEVTSQARIKCVKDFFGFLDGFIENLGRLRKVIKSGEASPEMVQTHDNFFVYVYDVLAGLKKVEAEKYTDYVPSIETLAEYGAKFCESSTAVLAEATGIEATNPDALEGAINMKRSLHMLEMANSESDRIGVWKVGEEHIPDMLRADMPSQVNIVTREVFRKELEEYFPRLPPGSRPDLAHD